ncbi:hypothetical protein REPUB_Repub10bG0091800 [Reevesia pubescens]
MISSTLNFGLVTEEYQAVNVSVKTDIWRSEVLIYSPDGRCFFKYQAYESGLGVKKFMHLSTVCAPYSVVVFKKVDDYNLICLSYVWMMILWT